MILKKNIKNYVVYINKNYLYLIFRESVQKMERLILLVNVTIWSMMYDVAAAIVLLMERICIVNTIGKEYIQTCCLFSIPKGP